MTEDTGYDRKIMGRMRTYGRLRDVSGANGSFSGMHRITPEAVSVTVKDHGLGHFERFEICATVQTDSRYEYYEYERQTEHIEGVGASLDEAFRRMEWKKL